MQDIKGFAISWFFAPYIGSADMDFFKRIKNHNISYDVAQVARDVRDDRVLNYATAPITRIEIEADYRNPRTKAAREQFFTSAVNEFRNSENEYDFIISHSNELISHEVAAEIKRIKPNLPWVAYFGDLFAKNPYIKYIKGYPLVKEDVAIETHTLRTADLIILNNDYQRDLMFSGNLRDLIHKAVVIPHCYDPAMYPKASKEPNDKFVFAHLGTLYHVKRTAEPVLKAVDRLLEIYPEYKNKFEILFYGGSPYSNDISVHAFMRNRNHVRFEDAVSYMDSLNLMCQADALLLIDGMFSSEEDDLEVNPFFPGKLVDYMGAMKPIMSITMEKGPTADIMRESGNLLADLRTDRIAYVLKRYIDRKVDPDYSIYHDYTVTKIAPAMEQAIRSIVKDSKSG